MTLRQPDFDIDVQIGAQSELWVSNICDMLARRSGWIEVKAPKPFLEFGSFFLEYECCGRDGIWRPSGIATTKARIFVFTFGTLPGGLMIETEWLRRAGRRAFEQGRRKECLRGSNPTRGVLVCLADINATKERDP